MKTQLLSLAALIGFQAQALDLETAFKSVTINKPACFIREYTPEHLAANKRQTVERIKVKLRQWKYDKKSDAQPMVGIQVKRKNENRVWTNNITCMNNQGSVLCAVECDGGSVEILSRDADGQLILKNNGVILHGGCGEEGKTIFLKSRRGGDDVFKLQQADEQACADVSEEVH